MRTSPDRQFELLRDWDGGKVGRQLKMGVVKVRRDHRGREAVQEGCQRVWARVAMQHAHGAAGQNKTVLQPIDRDFAAAESQMMELAQAGQKIKKSGCG